MCSQGFWLVKESQCGPQAVLPRAGAVSCAWRWFCKERCSGLSFSGSCQEKEILEGLLLFDPLLLPVCNWNFAWELLVSLAACESSHGSPAFGQFLCTGSWAEQGARPYSFKLASAPSCLCRGRERLRFAKMGSAGTSAWHRQERGQGKAGPCANPAGRAVGKLHKQRSRQRRTEDVIGSPLQALSTVALGVLCVFFYPSPKPLS